MLSGTSSSTGAGGAAAFSGGIAGRFGSAGGGAAAAGGGLVGSGGFGGAGGAAGGGLDVGWFWLTKASAGKSAEPTASANDGSAGGASGINYSGCAFQSIGISSLVGLSIPSDCKRS